MGDTTIECFDCGEPFLFTAGEQKFFQDKGWDSPKRCKACRIKNKQKHAMNPQPYEKTNIQKHFYK